MTYQKDSDIPYTYGQVVAMESAPSLNSTDYKEYVRRTRDAGPNYAAGKSKLVAWVILLVTKQSPVFLYFNLNFLCVISQFTSHCLTQVNRK